jgi:hypothetical protein
MRESSEPQRPTTITTVTIPQKRVTKPLKVMPPENETETEDDDSICRGLD